MIASISIVNQPESTGDTRWSSHYNAFNDGTSMIDDLSICKMDRINITKNVATLCEPQTILDDLELFNYQDRQSNKWVGFSNDNYDYLNFHDSKCCQILYLNTQSLFQSRFHFEHISFLLKQLLQILLYKRSCILCHITSPSY